MNIAVKPTDALLVMVDEYRQPRGRSSALYVCSLYLTRESTWLEMDKLAPSIVFESKSVEPTN